MAAVVLLVLAGCSRNGPAELSLSEIPAAMRTAFATARTALRTNAEGVTTLVTGKQYAAASLQLQALAANADISDSQRSVVAGATVAINAALQEQAAALEAQAGNAEGAKPEQSQPSKEDAAAATAVLEHHIRTK